MTHLGWIAAVTIALLPGLANAQPAARTFDELATRLKPSEDVWITDRSGTEVKARLADVTATTLTIQTRAGRLDLKADDVVRVRQRRPDPKWNGALIGAAAALAFPVWLCSNSYETGETCGENVQALGFVAVVGAGIGVWIDSMIKGRKVLYERPGGTATLRVAPLVSQRSIGVTVSFAGRVAR
jgi:hypothetical protein